MSEKEQVFAEYGIDWSLHSGYEVDHVISLELGGSNDISNLFPESYSIEYGARIKDRLENYVHDQACAWIALTCCPAREIATDWLKYYLVWQGAASVQPSPSAENARLSAVSASSSAASYYTSTYSTAKNFPIQHPAAHGRA